MPIYGQLVQLGGEWIWVTHTEKSTGRVRPLAYASEHRAARECAFKEYRIEKLPADVPLFEEDLSIDEEEALTKYPFFRVLVCGGRDFFEYKVVKKYLDSLYETVKRPILVIHGAAAGADSMAGMWVKSQETLSDRIILERRYPVSREQWNMLGKQAGFLRNSEMLHRNPDVDLVLAFPGGRGTDMMCKLAEGKNITVKRVE